MPHDTAPAGTKRLVATVFLSTMTESATRPERAAGTHQTTTTITQVRAGASVDTSQRVRRYTITMAFRTACFLLAVTLAHGWVQWALFAGAVFLPYLGVLLANQADETGRGTTAPATPTETLQLTSEPGPDVVEGTVVTG